MRGIKTISEYFGVEKTTLEGTGVFDRFLGTDAKLFIDPFLLDSLDIPEFASAREKIKARFRQIIKLLSLDEGMGFKDAVRLLTCKETKGVGIGHGAATDEGSGIGPVLAKKLALTGKRIVSLGLNDPEIFELLGLFQEDFGPDRLSDLTISILHDEFIAYTERVAKELGIVQVKGLSYKGRTVILPWIKEEMRHILFLPKMALRDLPMAQEKENIEYVAQHNNELRERLNQFVGEEWKDYLKEKENRKREFLTEAQYVSDVVTHYKNRKPVPYDYSRDPKGEVDWRDKGRQMAERSPLELTMSNSPDIEEIKGVVRSIIHHYKKNIEHNGLNEMLLKKSTGRYSERYAQKIFFSVADAYCQANNLDLSPESKSSTGPVDFKMSRGRLKVLVELKLTSNDIIAGITKQLPEYEKGEGAYGMFLVVLTGDHESKLQELESMKEKHLEEGIPFPEYFVVDARIKPTPSKRKAYDGP